MKEIKKVFLYINQHRKKMYIAIILLTCSVALGITSYTGQTGGNIKK